MSAQVQPSAGSRRTVLPPRWSSKADDHVRQAAAKGAVTIFSQTLARPPVALRFCRTEARKAPIGPHQLPARGSRKAAISSALRTNRTSPRACPGR
jgi:hypothetical protein